MKRYEITTVATVKKIPWWQRLWMYQFVKNRLISLGYIKKKEE